MIFPSTEWEVGKIKWEERRRGSRGHRIKREIVVSFQHVRRREGAKHVITAFGHGTGKQKETIYNLTRHIFIYQELKNSGIFIVF